MEILGLYYSAWPQHTSLNNEEEALIIKQAHASTATDIIHPTQCYKWHIIQTRHWIIDTISSSGGSFGGYGELLRKLSSTQIIRASTTHLKKQTMC